MNLRRSSLCKAVDSAAPDDSVFISSHCRAGSVVWYQFDLCRITFFFVYVHSPSSLSFPVFGSTPGGIFAFAYLQRHQYGTCVIPGDPLCKLFWCTGVEMSHDPFSHILSLSGPRRPRLSPRLTLLFVSLFVMQEDNSYSPTKSWLQRIGGQNSFTAEVHHSEWDSSSRLIYITGINIYTLCCQKFADTKTLHP